MSDMNGVNRASRSTFPLLTTSFGRGPEPEVNGTRDEGRWWGDGRSLRAHSLRPCRVSFTPVSHLRPATPGLRHGEEVVRDGKGVK